MSNRANKLKELYAQQVKCKACPRLVGTRSRVVIGRGNPDARIVVVGEAPGEQEDKTGIVFQGRAGDLLDEILGGLEKDGEGEGASPEDFYICNAGACRPTIDNPMTGRKENAKLTAEEVKNCRKWLHQIVRIIDPYLLILAGEYALMAFGINKPVGQVQGKMIDVRVDGVERVITYCAMPVYHPAFLLRKKDQPKLLEDTKDHFERAVERVWAFMRVAQGLSPVALKEE